MKRLLSNDVDELLPNKRSTRSQNKHNDIGLNINDFKLKKHHQKHQELLEVQAY
jgi:hypothetical protein